MVGFRPYQPARLNPADNVPCERIPPARRASVVEGQDARKCGSRPPRGLRWHKLKNFWHDMAARQWTPAQRARQSEAIQRRRPWETTKAPVTPEGKARSAMRGFKGNSRRQMKARRLIESLISEDAHVLAEAFGRGQRQSNFKLLYPENCATSLNATDGAVFSVLSLLSGGCARG